MIEVIAPFPGRLSEFLTLGAQRQEGLGVREGALQLRRSLSERRRRLQGRDRFPDLVQHVLTVRCVVECLLDIGPGLQIGRAEVFSSSTSFAVAPSASLVFRIVTSVERTSRIAELLHEAAETHHVVYRVVDGDDPD